MNFKGKVLLIYNHNAGNGMFKNNLDQIVERFQRRDLLVIPIRGGKPEFVQGSVQANREEILAFFSSGC